MARQLAMKGAAIPAVIHVLKGIEAQNDVFFLYFSQTFPKFGNLFSAFKQVFGQPLFYQN